MHHKLKEMSMIMHGQGITFHIKYWNLMSVATDNTLCNSKRLSKAWNLWVFCSMIKPFKPEFLPYSTVSRLLLLRNIVTQPNSCLHNPMLFTDTADLSRDSQADSASSRWQWDFLVPPPPSIRELIEISQYEIVTKSTRKRGCLVL